MSTPQYDLIVAPWGVFRVDPSDTVPLPQPARGIEFEAEGTIAYRTIDGSIDTIKKPFGATFICQIDMILEEGTTLTRSEFLLLK